MRSEEPLTLRSDPNLLTIEEAMTAGFRDGKSFGDIGHFDLSSPGVLTQSAADECAKEHPNGT